MTALKYLALTACICTICFAPIDCFHANAIGQTAAFKDSGFRNREFSNSPFLIKADKFEDIHVDPSLRYISTYQDETDVGVVRIYDARTGELHKKVNVPQGSELLCVASDAQRLCLKSGRSRDEISIWDISKLPLDLGSFKPVDGDDQQMDIVWAAFTRDHRLVTLSSYPRRFFRWEPGRDGQNWVRAARSNSEFASEQRPQFTPNGTVFDAGERGGSDQIYNPKRVIRLWNARYLTNDEFVLKGQPRIDHYGMSFDGSKLASSFRGTLSLWDLRTGEQSMQMKLPDSTSHSIRFLGPNFMLSDNYLIDLREKKDGRSTHIF